MNRDNAPLWNPAPLIVETSMSTREDNLKDEELALDPADDSLEDQALTWLVRMTSGDAGPEQMEAFVQWRNASPEHDQALADARQLWVELGRPLDALYAPRLASMQAPVPMHLSLSANVQFKQRPRHRWLPRAAAAAVLMLSVVAGQQWWSKWRFDQVTATGVQRTLALQDGSTMWLNTDSAADVRVDAKQRHVTLARGEAFFDVTHDPARPFTVDAGVGQIRVLGTAFGVQRDGDDVLVTVQRGRVQVSGGGTAPVIITPDMRARVHLGDKVKHVDLINADQELSWRNGRLIFEDRPLSEILNVLKRYDDRVVVVRYPEANKVRINAMIDLARIDEWYDGLQQTLPVEVSRIGPLVWVSGTDRDPQAGNKPPVVQLGVVIPQL